MTPPPPITTLTPPNAAVPNPSDDDDDYIDDSNCSTPYVSAPSSPGRNNHHHFFPSGFFYSAPTSPMHYVLSSSPVSLTPAASDASSASFEFEFSSRFDSPAAPDLGASMSSADELFLNGQIRPMKLCAHLSRPQQLPPFSEEDDFANGDVDDHDVFARSRDLRMRSRSQRRRTRSMSPLRSSVPFDWLSAVDDAPPKKDEEEREEVRLKETEATASASSSRCSSAGRSSKRWVFLKDFLRSKSEGGRNYNSKFWQNISFSPAKEKEKKVSATAEKKKKAAVATGGGGGRKRSSAHERHYAANRAQAEEMRKKTYLPYRQGLLGCLGFNSKSYGALHGFARALNPVSSR